MSKPERIGKTPISSMGLRSSAAPPLVFISHDSRDAKLAEIFSKLLSSVSAGVLKSFRSSDNRGSQGIEYGVEWFPFLMRQLAKASDVVCLLTKRSVERPWILYEAGVAKGKLNTPVHGLALGMPLNQANYGPFAQFQNSDDQEDSLTKLVVQLVNRIPGAEPDQEAIQMQVRAFKEGSIRVLAELADTEERESQSEPTDISVAKLFEEIKIMFQDLPSRLNAKLDRPSRSRFWSRVHPMMLFELDEMLRSSSNEPIGLLIVAAMFRDDLPWLYEIGMEAYRAAKTGDPTAVEKAFTSFRRAVEISTHGPFLHETVTSKEVHLLLSELPDVIDRLQVRYQSRPDRLNTRTTIGRRRLKTPVPE